MATFDLFFRAFQLNKSNLFCLICVTCAHEFRWIFNSVNNFNQKYLKGIFYMIFIPIIRFFSYPSHSFFVKFMPRYTFDFLLFSKYYQILNGSKVVYHLKYSKLFAFTKDRKTSELVTLSELYRRRKVWSYFTLKPLTITMMAVLKNFLF